MGKLDEKFILWEGVEKSTFKMAKKAMLFSDKILVLRLKKGEQLVWTKVLQLMLPPISQNIIAYMTSIYQSH